jgi:ethanolamine utilization microcompartment shell protein EutS
LLLSPVEIGVRGSGLHCGHFDRFNGLVILLNDLEVQNCFVNSLEVGIDVLHELLLDRVVNFLKVSTKG